MVEDALHCLHDCSHPKKLWLRSVGMFFPNFFVSVIWIGMIVWYPMQKLCFTSIIYGGFGVEGTTWFLVVRFSPWSKSNAVSLAPLLIQVKVMMMVWPCALLQSGSHLCWVWARLHVDGSFLRASSTMGCVSLLRDHNGNWIHGFASYKGIGEIFQDELIDVIQGLSMAWKAGTKVFISLFVDLIVWMLLRH